ncbi:MAG TPA: alpha/beta hydrolase, partial [Acidimicrobiales bacterium]
MAERSLPAALTAPRVEGAVTLRDGRRIGFAEYGPTGGRAVLWFPGTPGGRRQIPPEVRAAAAERGIRIVALERPGVGASSSHAYRSILEWAADVEECVDQLGIDHFGLVGLSGGGPYVLACAHRLPDRVVAGAVIGSVAPTQGKDAAEGGAVALTARFNSVLVALRQPLGLGLWATVRVLRPVASPVFDLFVRFSPAGDRAVFTAPGMKEMFTDDLIHASRRQFLAPIHDLVLFGRDWGFSPSDVVVPMYFWHGDEDYIVPLAHGEHLASLVPDSELQVKIGAAHLANLALGVEVLDTILAHWPDDDG